MHKSRMSFQRRPGSSFSNTNSVFAGSNPNRSRSETQGDLNHSSRLKIGFGWWSSLGWRDDDLSKAENKASDATARFSVWTLDPRTLSIGQNPESCLLFPCEYSRHSFLEAFLAWHVPVPVPV
jgi:hypothetical protein